MSKDNDKMRDKNKVERLEISKRTRRIKKVRNRNKRKNLRKRDSHFFN